MYVYMYAAHSAQRIGFDISGPYHYELLHMKYQQQNEPEGLRSVLRVIATSGY